MTYKDLFNLGISPYDELRKIVEICEKSGDYCLIGGLALNHYVEPVFTADADFVVAAENLDRLRDAFKKTGFKFKKNRYDIEVSFSGSVLKVHLTFDGKYQIFFKNAKQGKLFDEIEVKIADIKDLIKGKSWAFSDPAQKLSKRTKDKLDLIRIYEEMPRLREFLPTAIVKEIEADNLTRTKPEP